MSILCLCSKPQHDPAPSLSMLRGFRSPCHADGHPAPMTSANSGTTHAHPPYSGYRGVVTRMPELHGTVLHVGGVVDVGFGVLWFVCSGQHCRLTFWPRGCVYLCFQTHLQMTFIF